MKRCRTGRSQTVAAVLGIVIAPYRFTPYTHRRIIEDDMSVADKSEKKSGGLGETVSVIVQALLLALVIRTLFFQPFSIHGSIAVR